MLCVGGSTYLVQSAAIMRYLGKLTTLYPQDALLAAKVDAIVDQGFFRGEQEFLQ